MDISHVIKKIRNNISKSGDSQFCKQLLKLDDKYIKWDHFKQAYMWDISTNPFPIHHRLSQEHIYLSPEGKMRNHLAEEVLNGEMLHLMKQYRESLGDAGFQLDATIELLECTTVFIRNFRDSRPITDVSDERLKQNSDAINWFINWENKVKRDTNIKNKEKYLISHQTREDIISSVKGFEELCIYKLKKSNSSIIPSRVNSDIIENMFCQQRTLHNGANTNPNYLGYCNSVNSVILGQTSISIFDRGTPDDRIRWGQGIKSLFEIVFINSVFISLFFFCVDIFTLYNRHKRSKSLFVKDFSSRNWLFCIISDLRRKCELSLSLEVSSFKNCILNVFTVFLDLSITFLRRALPFSILRYVK